MKPQKASKPREIGTGYDQLAIDRYNPEEVEQCRNIQGMVIQTRRYMSPFVSLRNTGTLSPNQSAAAGRFMALYAVSKGIAGQRDREDVIVDEDRLGRDYAQEAIVRARGRVWAGDELARIRSKIGRDFYDVLVVLCQEFLEGDAMAAPKDEDGKPQTRWRTAIKAHFKAQGRVLSTPNEQNLTVWWACEALRRVS